MAEWPSAEACRVAEAAVPVIRVPPILAATLAMIVPQPAERWLATSRRVNFVATIVVATAALPAPADVAEALEVDASDGTCLSSSWMETDVLV